MIDPHMYEQDNTYRTYEEARKRKDILKQEGYRTKLRKLDDGSFVIYKKNIALIDSQGTKTFQTRTKDKHERYN